MQLVHRDHPALRQVSENVLHFDEDLERIVREMRPLASSLRSTSEVIFTSVPACRATLS